MNGEYPDKKEIQRIERWDVLDDPMGMIEFIEPIFEHYGVIKKRKWNGMTIVELHTGGWSGNEQIVGALHQNNFFLFYWEKSLRGGHYWFHVKKYEKTTNSKAV